MTVDLPPTLNLATAAGSAGPLAGVPMANNTFRLLADSLQMSDPVRGGVSRSSLAFPMTGPPAYTVPLVSAAAVAVTPATAPTGFSISVREGPFTLMSEVMGLPPLLVHRPLHGAPF